MRNLRLHIIIFLIFFSLFNSFASENESLYESIEHLKLENGLEVLLAPSPMASQIEIKIEVDTGVDAETPENWGVAHLLEHVLFRDKNLRDEMTYLQLIRENGGSANGSTSNRLTTYFGTIPKKKGTWLFNSFSDMILLPVINDQYVEKEKGTVELERGRPSPFAEIFGVTITEILYPTYLKQPGFYVTEFGVSLDPKYTRTQEQLSTRRLTTKQVSDFYKDYYYPENMRIFIAGSYDRDEIMNLINKRWASIPGKSGKKLPERQSPILRDKPYIRLKASHVNPSIGIGTKFIDLTQKEEVVIHSYTKFLAHKLMKEIRNKKGQTYTAYADFNSNNKFGYAIVSMKTTRETYNENVKYAKSIIENDAEKGNISENDFNKARDLFSSEFAQTGAEALDRMNLLNSYYETIENYGTFEAPSKILSKVTLDEYRNLLKKNFTKNQRYMYSFAPNYFFAYDSAVIAFFFLILFFILVKKVVTKSFSHDKVKWVRKVEHPPLKILDILSFIVIIYLSAHFSYGLEWYVQNSALWQSTLLLSEHAAFFLSVAILIMTAQLVLSAVPRKLMIMDDKLVIKSLSYYSKQIPLNHISHVYNKSLLSFFFSLDFWKRVHKVRAYKLSFAFWRACTFIELDNGYVYIFSLTSPKQALKELQPFILKQSEVQKPTDNNLASSKAS